MNIKDFDLEMRRHVQKTLAGYYVFIPPKLPPELGITWSLASQLSEADRAISQLAGVARTLPNPHLLINPFVRREAVLSSRIEGTQASLSDLLAFEASPDSPLDPSRPPKSDVQEVQNYVLALEHGLNRLPYLPISSRLIRELHERLMNGVRGGYATPGDFRTSQNWIGPPGCVLEKATYVPPPVVETHRALSDLEKFLHGESELPPLVQLAMVHYQFEAIHPFLDGNGRIGRLLMVLLLCSRDILPAPVLYLSAYFERNRAEYYRRLLDVSQHGAWEPWIKFFLAAVATQSEDAVERSEQLVDLQVKYRSLMAATRAPVSLLLLLDRLFSYPAITVAGAAREMGCTPRTAQQCIDRLIETQILTEVTGRQRNRIFMATEIIRISEAPEL